MGRFKFKAAVFLLCLFVTASLSFAQPHTLKVSFLDVGQGEAALLWGPDFTILIDAGDVGRTDVIAHLKSLGVAEIDLMILTHPHADHIGQAAEVLKTFSVSEVWLPGFLHTTNLFENLIDVLLASDAAYREPRRGEIKTFGDLALEVLNPKEPLGSYMHDSCLVVRAVYKDIRFLFTGDIERKTEREMEEEGLELQAEILQVAHHGSATSSDIEFILAVEPKTAVYSAGAENPFGHPHREVVFRFQNLGIPLYGTDVHGSITVSTDGKNYEVRTEKKGDLKKVFGVDLNSAGLEELQQIIHIGPARAQEIIDLRPLKSIACLAKVSGLGPKRIADIKKQGLAYVGE